jgi:hypothetical protein
MHSCLQHEQQGKPGAAACQADPMMCCKMTLPLDAAVFGMQPTLPKSRAIPIEMLLGPKCVFSLCCMLLRSLTRARSEMCLMWRSCVEPQHSTCLSHLRQMTCRARAARTACTTEGAIDRPGQAEQALSFVSWQLSRSRLSGR